MEKKKRYLLSVSCRLYVDAEDDFEAIREALWAVRLGAERKSVHELAVRVVDSWTVVKAEELEELCERVRVAPVPVTVEESDGEIQPPPTSPVSAPTDDIPF
jgi:hypothetical protein